MALDFGVDTYVYAEAVMSKPRIDFGGEKGNGPLSLKRRLWAGVESDNYEGIKKALDDGADINSKNELGYTALIDTLNSRRRNWARIAGLLIHRGADVRGEYGHKKASRKFIALNILIQIDDVDGLDVVEQYAAGLIAA